MGLEFALNHRVAPDWGVDGFFCLASRLDVPAVEIRNDLEASPFDEETAPESIRRSASARGLRILSVNALQRFNDWTQERVEEAKVLGDRARRAGAEALVLCPVNENGWRPDGAARRAALAEALTGLAPILEGAGLVGLVEPLGFAECSLRLKRHALEVIDAVGEAGRFKLLHDTFHHFVAGETEIFPDRTGLVHLSGVEDCVPSRERMRDPDRVLVGPDDRVGNLAQLRALAGGGYAGAISFEPFSASIARSRDIAEELRASMDFIASGLRAEAA